MVVMKISKAIGLFWVFWASWKWGQGKEVSIGFWILGIRVRKKVGFELGFLVREGGIGVSSVSSIWITFGLGLLLALVRS